MPETLIPALDELLVEYRAASSDRAFRSRLASLLRDYVGRPTPLYLARRLTAHYGGPTVYLKREDLCHTGAHKINNALGQALLAQRMGKRRVIAETGAGQHGVATATACALLGLSCCVYMGSEDMRRQALNVDRMRLLGATVEPVTTGTCTLKDATNEALRDWVASVRDTHYIIGSVVGPHPFPMIVREFQSIIGRETAAQVRKATGRPPDAIVACVGGGSNAMGIFAPFVGRPGVRLIGVEAAGRGLDTADHCATLSLGEPGILHGSLSSLLQDCDGQVRPTHSISAGLDYPGVGPEHAYLRCMGLAEYTTATDEEAMEALRLLSRLEGIIPALESAHAVAHLARLMPTMQRTQTVVVNLSGRGDKDMETVAERLRATQSGGPGETVP